MFTGIIQAKKKIINNFFAKNANKLIIANGFDNLLVGESIAVNGVCLTLVSYSTQQMEFDVSSETLLCTNLAKLTIEDEVNLERAMLASTRFGGHYVSGHVDQTATITNIQILADYRELEIGDFDLKSLRYLLPKGSITVNGVSLTINSVHESRIKLMLVPHTLTETNFEHCKVGQHVNIEFDYLTRIVEHQLELCGRLNVIN